MKKLLLTGFEPFLGFPINPTEAIVKSLDKKCIGQYEIESLLLPVDFLESAKILIERLKMLNPDAVVSLGLAAGRNSITPERVAINCQDGEPDNNGVIREDALICEDGPDAYFSTLPIRKMVQTLNQRGYPASISNSAGTYLCNNIMYSLLHELKQSGRNIPAGFIHIPASHELVTQSKKRIPSWSQNDLEKAISIIIEETI
ncbi:pyroglutamyl-peptidase I [Bacillus sp. FJAT-49736]|uniref:pyroglutamyl-peptidase I n=1 Tax=Bacillus sp. FJAT-49736 TaxID=2833582 RepID=UPI001BC95498|nr:pyroglutamyl-peptidase I [Bacillus sp. FJAT-49736]MBS4175437.1 pyroglutamyl-peptidase I [Bacillus sp. FJAT-49736]